MVGKRCSNHATDNDVEEPGKNASDVGHHLGAGTTKLRVAAQTLGAPPPHAGQEILRAWALRPSKGPLNQPLGRVRAPLRIFQPFSEEIQGMVVPQHFREPSIEAYDSSDDPHDHVAAFQTQLFISGGDNAISCKMFAWTLKDVALHWSSVYPRKLSPTWKIWPPGSRLNS